MAKEECVEPWNKSGGGSAVRHRKICPTSEKTPAAHLSGGKDARSLKEDARSSNGTSAGAAPKGAAIHGPPGRVLLMLLLLMLLAGLSFSTRLYKISQPPHVW